MSEFEGSPEQPIERWQIQLEELEGLAQKELGYLDDEGITPELEELRQEGKAPTMDETLEDVNRGAEAVELQERKFRLDELGPEVDEVLGTIRRMYAEIKHAVLKKPGTEELVKDSEKTSNAWESIQAHYRSYELGHLSKEKFIDAMRETFDTFLEIINKLGLHKNKAE